MATILLSPVFTASASANQPFQLGAALDNPATVGALETAIGRHLDNFLWYQNIDQTLDVDLLTPVAQGGRTIQLAWLPIPVLVDPAASLPAYRLRNFTAGNFDTALRRWARELRDFGYPVQLRPMSEMNGDWVSWSDATNGNAPGDYIAAWRHMHDIFVQEGATNVKWIWSPNRDASTAEANTTFDKYYPGDQYVDYVGIVGYNWGTMYHTSTWISSWESVAQVFGYSYDIAASRTAKPIVLSEMASTELGGSKAFWITDLFTSLPVRFPRVIGISWFNLNKETDWRIESSLASLTAFRTGIRNLDATLGAACGRPDLRLDEGSSRWATYADYRGGILSVDFNARNLGLHDAYNLTITGSSSSSGVTPASIFPLRIPGSISLATPEVMTIIYYVSSGMQTFFTSTFATATDSCGNVYTYPSP